MGAESFPFQNCSNFTDKQFAAIVLGRGITASVCCAILLIVLVALLLCARCHYQRVCGTVVKRLIIWLTAIDVVYLLFLALSLKQYYHPEVEEFCIADGFFDEFFALFQLYFTLGICIILFLKLLKITTSWECITEFYKRVEDSTFTCCCLKINKPEVSLVFVTFVPSLLSSVIPFATKSYGLFGSWCWIRIFKTDCSRQAGWWEQIALWDIPYGLVAVLTIVLFVMSLLLLGYGFKNARVRKLVMVVAIADSIISLTLMLILRILQMIAYFCYPIKRFDLTVLFAVVAPVTGAVIPLALLVAIYLPFSSLIVKCAHYKHHRYQDQGETTRQNKTFHHTTRANIPSHTTWDSPHSQSGLERLPFSSDAQKNYGSNDSAAEKTPSAGLAE